MLVALLIHPQTQLLQTGSTAPAVTLQDVDGTTVHAIPDAAHRVTALVFVTTACAPCTQSLTALCDAAPAAQAHVVVVDAGRDTAGSLSAFSARATSATCAPALLLDPDLTVSRAYQATAVPALYVVDSTGHISFAGTGADGTSGAVSVMRRLADAG